MEKASSWSVLSGVPASLVLAPTPSSALITPLRELPGQQRVPERLYQSSSVGSWNQLCLYSTHQENDRHKNSSQPNPDHSDLPECHTAEAPSKVSF